MRNLLEELAYTVLPKVAPGRLFAHREWITVVRLAEVLLDGAELGISMERVADNLETFVCSGRSRRAWRIRLLFTIIDLSTLTTHGKRFSELSLETRKAVITSYWVKGSHRFPGDEKLWHICSRARALILVGAYGDKKVEATTGYVPVLLRPRFKKVRPASKLGDAA